MPTLLTGMLAVVSVATSAQEKAGQEAKKTGPPTFKSAWKMSLPADTKRIAVADVIAMGKPKLLTLDADGKMTVHNIVEDKPVKETSLALGKDAAKFVVGHFVKDKPALIIAPGGTFYWDKDTFVQKPAPPSEGVFASLRLKDGSESFFALNQGAPPTTYVLDLSAQPVYKEGPPLPQPEAQGGSIREIVLNLPPEFFEMQPFPEAVKKGGIARLFDPHGEDKLYGLFAWQVGAEPYVAVVAGDSLFPEPKSDAMPIWKSAKLAGKVRDIALGSDIKGTKTNGFYVLQEAGSEQKETLLEFFALE